MSLTRLCAALALSAATVVTAPAIAGCDVTADLGHDDRSIDASPETRPGFVLLPDEPPPTPPDAPLATLKARCADPAHGPVARYEDFAGFRKQVVGRWFSCSTRQPLVADASGIELHADGTWNLLREDGTGKLVDQRGLDHEGRWGEKYTGFAEYFQIDVEGEDMPGSFSFAFENAPRRMRLRSVLPLEGTDGDGWYVAAAADDMAVLP